MQIEFKTRRYGNSKINVDIAIEFAADLMSKIFHDYISAEVIKFIFIGSIGAVINLIIFYILFTHLDLSFNFSQAFAVVLSMCMNYFLHNIIIFRNFKMSGTEQLKGLFKYGTVVMPGLVLNIGITAYLYNPTIPTFSVCIGILAGLLFNYLLSREYVWKV